MLSLGVKVKKLRPGGLKYAAKGNLIKSFIHSEKWGPLLQSPQQGLCYTLPTVSLLAHVFTIHSALRCLQMASEL